MNEAIKQQWWSLFIVGTMAISMFAGCTIERKEIRNNSDDNIVNNGLVAKQGNWIYYINSSQGNNLYKIRIDGSERQKVK